MDYYLAEIWFIYIGKPGEKITRLVKAKNISQARSKAMNWFQKTYSQTKLFDFEVEVFECIE